MEKVSSGVEGFDQLIYGGFPKGRSYLVAGEPGTGKTIFLLQFLLQGIKEGEKGIYISIDEKPEQIVADALALGWDLSPQLEKGMLQIIDVTSYFSSIKHSDGSVINIDDIVNDILGYVKKSGASRLAIDPIAPLIFSSHQYPNVVEYIRKLVFSIEENINCTSLLTSYIPFGSNKVSSFGIEEFAASGIVVLKLVDHHSKKIRSISVRKMRGTRVNLSEYSFEILSDRGITLRQPL